MSTHPDAKLTLREACKKHYDKEKLTKSTVTTSRYRLDNWERFTDNPPVGKITGETLAEFREAASKSGLSPATINAVYRRVRAILRRLGPPVTGNPTGLSIIPSAPHMKLLRETIKHPYRIPPDDLSRFYTACRHAQRPCNGVAAVDQWRCLIVLAYVTALRKVDLFAIRLDEDVDTLHFLHPAACEHIKRIHRPGGGLLFRGFRVVGSRFYKFWHEIIKHAGIERPFDLRDIRQTSAGEIYCVGQRLGEMFLRHTPRLVNEELREAILKMRLPIGFNSLAKTPDRRMARNRISGIVQDRRARRMGRTISK